MTTSSVTNPRLGNRVRTTIIADDYNDPLFERKIKTVTEGLKPRHLNLLTKISKENAVIISDFIINMITEINPSNNRKIDVIETLSRLSKHNNNKSFRDMTRHNILAFLDSFRKLEVADPQHKWIGTYNFYRSLLVKFFKWLYNPDLDPAKRQKPSVIDNIPRLKRKEQSIYKPTDLWTSSDDLLFLKYCPSKRMKCYHMISRDLSARPAEILKLKIKDAVFKSENGHQYAEVLVNGKTGSRPPTLIQFNSLSQRLSN